MAAPQDGKDAYNQDAAYPLHEPMPPNPPPYGHYPPPPGPPPGPPPPNVHVQPATVYQTSLGTTAIIPGAIIVQQNMGPHPTRTTCRSCNQEMVTRIDRRASMKTHLMAALLCILGCWPFVCIPYCVDSCLSTDHFCSNCGSYVGSYSR